MSGGSFNYLYSKLEDDPFGHLGQLQDMVDFLKNSDEPEVAQELQNLLSYLEKTKQEVWEKVQKVQSVIHNAEWWASMDTTKGSFQEEVVKLFLSKGEPVQAIKYYRRVNKLYDMQGFRDAKEYVYNLKQEMEL